MRFDLSDDQHEIKRTARDLLAARSPMDRVRAAAEGGGYDERLWAELRELGWPGIAVAEEYGGQGLGVVELAVILEELGYACAATPLLGTALAALAIQHAGSPAQRERWLPVLASGEASGALGDSAGLVADGDRAGVVVLVDQSQGVAKVVEPAAGEVETVITIDPTRGYARVQPASADALEGDVAAAVDRALVAVSAELVGLCQRALDMTVAYVKERKQFGVPVGAFQAVGHTGAQMLRDTESARSATYYAAWAADAEGAASERLAIAAAMAKAAASDAGRAVTASAIQLHGGIGFTWEADVHWLYKRAQLDAQLLGGAGTHRVRLAQLVAQERTAASTERPELVDAR